MSGLKLGNPFALRKGLLSAGIAWIAILGFSIALTGSGCPLFLTDTDGDGVADSLDGCPNDANKVEPGDCGCGVADTDTDGDGTADCNDACPNDPDKIAEGDCGCGVAETDTDGDGTPDCNDLCPNNPDDASGAGCDLAVTVADATAEGGDTVTLLVTANNANSPVTFETTITTNSLTAGTVEITDATTQTPKLTFSNDADGSVVVTSVVTDLYESGSDTATITVTPTPEPADTTFTTSPFDDLMGTAENDTFNALLDGGTQTLDSTDIADGGEGTDTLVGQLNADTGPELSSIESASLSVNGAVQLDMGDIADMTSIAVTTLTGGAFTLANVPNIIDLSIARSDQAVNVNYGATVVSGTADAMNLAAERVTGGVNITIAGIETINLSVSGSVANAFELVAAALETLNVDGSADLTMATVPPTVETLDASAATGDLTLTQAPGAAATAISTGSGDDDVTLTADTDLAADLGAGDDLITPSAFTDADDTIDGGDGDDIVALPIATWNALDAAEVTGITNVESAAFIDAINAAIDFATAFPNDVINVIASAGFNAGTVTIFSGATVTSIADNAGAENIVIGGTGTSDSATVVLDGADGTALDATGVEALTLSSVEEDGTVDGGNNALTGNITSTPSAGVGNMSLAITGDQDLDLQGTVAASPVDASAFTGDLTLTAAAQATITGGTGDDALTGSASADNISGGEGDDTLTGAAGNDALNGGAGDDTIQGDGGADALTGGDDSDTFRYAAVTDGSAADPGSATGADVISDLTPGTSGDVLAFNGDVFKDPDDAANVVTDIDFQTITCDSDGTNAVGLVDPADNTVLPIVVCTTTLDNWAAVETLLDATIGDGFAAANDAAVAVVNVTGIGQIVVFDPDSDTADDLRVLVQLSPTITLGDLVAGNFDEYDN